MQDLLKTQRPNMILLVTTISEDSGYFEELGLNACRGSLEMVVFKLFLIIWDEDNTYRSWKGAVADDNGLVAGGEIG